MPLDELQPSAAALNADASLPGAAQQATPSVLARVRHGVMLAIKLALTAGIVYWLVQSGKLDLTRIYNLRPSWALAGLAGLTIFSLGLPGWRWWYLLKVQGTPVSLMTALRLTWVGYLAALVLPGAAGGDMVKAYLIIRGRTSGRIGALGTVFVDRLFGLYSLMFLGWLPLAWWWMKGEMPEGAPYQAGVTLVLLGGMTAALLLVAWPLTRRFMLRLLPGMWRTAMEQSWGAYVGAPGIMALCFGISLVIDVVAVLSFAFAGEALGLGSSAAAAFLAGPLVVAANGIPLTPGGAGVGEAVSEQLFAGLGVSGGAEAMLLVRVMTILVTLPALITGWKVESSDSTRQTAA